MAAFSGAAVSGVGLGFAIAMAIFASARMVANQKEQQALIFTYGPLKKGFPDHSLLRDMLHTGEASYIGPYTTVEKFPLLCGPLKVPFLLNFPGSGHRVSGELYTVTPAALARIDKYERLTKGPYERLPVEVEPAEGKKKEVFRAEAYYAHRSFAEEMQRGGEFFGIYTKKEAEGYVKRPYMNLFLYSPWA